MTDVPLPERWITDRRVLLTTPPAWRLYTFALTYSVANAATACLCPGAQTLHPDEAIWGHFVVTCREPGCRSVWYDPPHVAGTTVS